MIYSNEYFTVINPRTGTSYRRYVVIGTLTALYSAVVVQGCMSWAYTIIVYCSNSNFRETIFLTAAGSVAIPPFIKAILCLAEISTFILADAFMVYSI